MLVSVVRYSWHLAWEFGVVHFLSVYACENVRHCFALFFRIEMYCRELTERFEDVWVVSGPLTLPQTGSDGKKVVSYQVGTCFNIQAYAICMSIISCCLVFFKQYLLSME